MPPKTVEREARRRGGVVRYRMMRRGRRLFRIVVVREPGPRGGRTIAYEVTPKRRKRRRG